MLSVGQASKFRKNILVLDSKFHGFSVLAVYALVLRPSKNCLGILASQHFCSWNVDAAVLVKRLYCSMASFYLKN